jgi:hypothetical protein
MPAIELVWDGGEHPFQLNVGELRALQAKCDAGPMYVLTRLLSVQWYVDDVLETIRLGLIGGGMDEALARKLVDAHVPAHRMHKNVPLAANILRHSIMEEDADDQPGDDSPGEATAGTDATTGPAEN